MSKLSVDVAVIGTGPAASTVARKARGEGHRVAVVEAREFGGTCALRGCNPKKVYTNAANLLDQVRGAQGKLIDADSRIIWSDLLNFKNEFTRPVLAKSRKSLEDDGIETLQGTAKFVSPLELAVGDDRIQSRKIVIATGAKPVPLGFAGGDLAVTSDEFMELSEMPPSVVFIGGGYISMEFAHAVASSGSKVTLFERGERVLAPFDSDLVRQLCDWSKEKGIEIRTESEVRQIEKRADRFVVHYREGNETNTIECDLVVHGAGRVPNIDSLDLAVAGISASEQGIEVDCYLRCEGNHDVFAAGDCAATGRANLTPTANEEARVISMNLFSDSPRQSPDYGKIPRVAFTSPPIAAVGCLESEIEPSGALQVRHEDTSTWGSTRKGGHPCSGFKTLVDKRSGRIVGAHLLGPGAADVINIFALAMKFGLSAKDLKSTLMAFPTFASDTRKMV